jgi:uncharacterized membrane protein YeaQ/YmgE (transglycosylase-associated protein family)
MAFEWRGRLPRLRAGRWCKKRRMQNHVKKLSNAGICLLGIAAGLYGAWCATWLVHMLYLGKAKSFDRLTDAMLAGFLVAASVLCPLFSWLALKGLKAWRARKDARRKS